MKNLFEMLQAIFGKNVINKTIGTRTNVIKLPSNETNPLKKQFDVAKAADNPDVLEKIKKVIEDEIPYLSKMNDSERLIYEGNVRRLHDTLIMNKQITPTVTAEVIGIGTKEPITGEGLMSLTKEAGQINPPGTMAGNVEARVNQLKKIGKELEKQTGEKATVEDILKEFGTSQGSLARMKDEGLVRSTARQILINDIKEGKIKNITVEQANTMREPLDSFRQIYGEDALEQLDSLIPDFKKLTSEIDAEKLARSKFNFDPNEARPKGSYTEEEMKVILETPEKKAKGGSVGLDYLVGK
jgi:hypothetical protein